MNNLKRYKKWLKSDYWRNYSQIVINIIICINYGNFKFTSSFQQDVVFNAL